jgi:hypothetical protein
MIEPTKTSHDAADAGRAAKAKGYAKRVLRGAGLLPAADTVLRWASVAGDPARRRAELEAYREFLQFKREFGSAFGAPLHGAGQALKRALVVSIGLVDTIKVELALIKGLELAGYAPVVLADRHGWCAKYYEAVGVGRMVFWDEFLEPTDPSDAERVLDRVGSVADLVALEYLGARVGKYAASTALRHLRVGSLDLGCAETRRCLIRHLASAKAYARASQRLVAAVRPQLALSVDPGYTPRGELYDACLAAGIDTVTWNAAHRSNALMLKRYAVGNRDVHPASLSGDSWKQIREESWTDVQQHALREELYQSYVSGDWYSEVGTQFNTRVLHPHEVRGRLDLDQIRKTAVIFPHIFWDGTFFWGTDLFCSYEEWFVETVRAAIANPEVNWVIKIHPAHQVKNARDGFLGECAEVRAIREQIGQLPAHVETIPADSDINTFSLFDVMDYCVTVRGTIGIEAASFGIPVLTAGSGRYDRRGFTIDSDSREEYLARLACLHTVPRLSTAQRELAERYAYGVFVRRPLPLTTVALEFEKDGKASRRTRVNVRSPEELRTARDLRAFSSWVKSGREDFDALDGAS